MNLHGFPKKTEDWGMQTFRLATGGVLKDVANQIKVNFFEIIWFCYEFIWFSQENVEIYTALQIS